MSAHNRPERVAHLLQQRLAEVFARGLKDPRLGLVTITGVKMSPDLREARTFWTVHGDAEVRKETAKGLSAARGYLRHELSSLGLRVLPDLHFTYDEAIDRGDRIEQLLREVHEADDRRPPSTEERALPATGGAPRARSIGEERALPATGGAPRARSIGEERALPATGGAPRARSIGEERALPATDGGSRPEHTKAVPEKE